MCQYIGPYTAIFGQEVHLITGSFHTHSRYCDGEGSIEEVVEAAIDAGLADVGISSHAPLPFATDWNMPLSLLGDYAVEVRRLRHKYRDRIAVWLGAELDYIPGDEVGDFQRDNILSVPFDYFVGSVHFLGSDWPPRSFDGTRAVFEQILHEEYGGDIRLMVEDYYSRVCMLPGLSRVKIVGHLDVIKRWNAESSFFTEKEPWYTDCVESTLEVMARSDVVVELNTAGWLKGLGAPYPSPWILERCRDLHIPVTVSADAHTPQNVVWGFQRAEELLKSMNIQPVRPDV